MKKIKCIKCGLRFKDRKDSDDIGVNKTLCFNCKFIWKCLGMMIQGFSPKINRDITLHLDYIDIRKKRKYDQTRI